jgi:hypothetical protein
MAVYFELFKIICHKKYLLKIPFYEKIKMFKKGLG